MSALDEVMKPLELTEQDKAGKTAGWVVWLQWVVASALAIPVAAVALAAVTRFSAQEFEGARDYAMIGSFVGALTGLAQ